jgi:hypothetical protein
VIAEPANRPIADVFVPNTPEKIVKEPFPERARRRLHLLHLEALEHGGEDRDTAGKNRCTIVVEAWKLKLAHLSGGYDRLLPLLPPLLGDAMVRPTIGAKDVGDGEDGAGRSEARLPTQRAIAAFDRLELEERSDLRAPEVFLSEETAWKVS